MAAFNFPDTTGAPTDGSFTYAPNGADDITYAWNGITWQIVGGGGGAGGGGASIEISPTPPSPANPGDLWFNSDDGRLYVYYVQANGQEQWVDASPPYEFDGGVVNQSITTPERTITDSAFDLSTGPYWYCSGGITVPNPTNAVSGMAGTIRLTAAATGWSSNFSTAPEPANFPAIIPFYVESPTQIRLGNAVEVA